MKNQLLPIVDTKFGKVTVQIADPETLHVRAAYRCGTPVDFAIDGLPIDFHFQFELCEDGSFERRGAGPASFRTDKGRQWCSIPYTDKIYHRLAREMDSAINEWVDSAEGEAHRAQAAVEEAKREIESLEGSVKDLYAQFLAKGAELKAARIALAELKGE